MRFGTWLGQLQPIFYANEMLKTCIFLHDGRNEKKIEILWMYISKEIFQR
jgi:hypothetical protein